MFRAKSLAGGIIALALLVATPVAAHAQTYASAGDSQGFAGSAGGWNQRTDYAGLCLPTLVCPAVTNDWVGGGGAGNDGYIRTQFLSLASTLAGTSTGIWQSPAFTYNGNKGRTPTAVNLDLDIRPQVNALLGATAVNNSSYAVDLVDTATGRQINAVPDTPLVNDSGWRAIPSAAVNPRSLVIGHSYRVQITTIYHAVATVVATGEVGYDNVRLSATGRKGSAIQNSSQLTQYVLSFGISNSAAVAHHSLKVTVRCPVKAAPKRCAYRVWGLAGGKHSKRATVYRSVVVGAGHHRTLYLRIRPRYYQHYLHAKRILVKAQAKVGRHVKTTVTKKVTIAH